MGASQHKEAGSPKTELSAYQDTTPRREQCIPKRQLPLDPRSPTDNIARTPIMVDQTPDALHELDPRSPTLGIERTPLSVILSKGNATALSFKLYLVVGYFVCFVSSHIIFSSMSVMHPHLQLHVV